MKESRFAFHPFQKFCILVLNIFLLDEKPKKKVICMISTLNLVNKFGKITHFWPTSMGRFSTVELRCMKCKERERERKIVNGLYFGHQTIYLCVLNECSNARRHMNERYHAANWKLNYQFTTIVCDVVDDGGWWWCYHVYFRHSQYSATYSEIY